MLENPVRLTVLFPHEGRSNNLLDRDNQQERPERRSP